MGAHHRQEETHNRAADFEKKWNMTTEELAQLVEENPSLRSFIMGYGAELQLRKKYFEEELGSRVTGLHKEDDHDRSLKGDLTVALGERDVVFEVKSLQSNSTKWDAETETLVCEYQCDASDARYVELPDGTRHQTTCLLRGEFDILAVNLFPVTNDWNFLFALNADLASPTSGKLKNPDDPEHGRALSVEELAALLKSSQKITFRKGWRWEPDIYFADPFDAVEELLARRTATEAETDRDELEKHVEAKLSPEEREAKIEKAERNRQRARDAATAAINSFGTWAS